MTETQMLETMDRCISCHQEEHENWLSGDHSETYAYILLHEEHNKTEARNEKTHFDLDSLPTPVILAGTDTVLTPVDPVYRLCVQFHAPSVWHQNGSPDDRTPHGVHEGLSCRSCHEPHSNYQHNSCDKCHPAISNCKLDVIK